MPLDPASRRLRAKQVGMLMQAYRHAYDMDGRRNRLSQEGLLRLMGQVDPMYLERYNHSTVARWESGATRPNRERLEVFGKALNLTVTEIQGLVWLAGFHDDSESTQVPEIRSEAAEIAPETSIAAIDETEEPASHTPSYAGQVTRYVLAKFALPGLAVAAVGYILARLGWNAGWIMALYVVLAIALVLVQSFLRVRRSPELREIFFITVFFLLSGNLLQAPTLRMDPYGFYALGDFANTPIPYLLSLIVNLMLALAAGLMFDFLWRWQYASTRGSSNTYHRAAWTSFPPLLFVYVCALFLCCLGTWVIFLFVFSIVGGTFMCLLVLHDENMNFNSWERRLLLQGAVGLILVLSAIAGATVLTIYLVPSSLSIPDHTLVRSWEIDFDALGYSPDELLERYRIGAAWSALSTFVYMIIVLGGSLLVTIYRLGGEHSGPPAIDVAEKPPAK